MEGITVHRLNPELVVSLYELPGFKKLGTVVVRDDEGRKSGLVTVYYVGSFFEKNQVTDAIVGVHDAVLRLARNFAVKARIGVAATRLNLSTAIRENGKRLTVELA